MTGRVPADLSDLVQARAAGRCEYRRAPQLLIGQVFHIDHIKPRSAGGWTTANNLCLTCSHCNIAKSDKTEAADPRTKVVTRLFNPRIDKWDEHFRWSSDWKRLTGRTAIGRATVVTLDMNAKLLQQARPFWRAIGLLP